MSGCNIAAALPRLAGEAPERVAMRCPGRRGSDGFARYDVVLSYGELDRRSDAIAAGLAGQGIVRGSRVVVMVRPSPEFFLLMFALFKAGAVPVLVDPGIDKRALRQCLGEWLIRGANAFAGGAASQGVEKPLAPDVKRALLAPYDNWQSRISTVRFVQDIPLQPGDRAWDLVEDAGKRLPTYADRPAFIGWGLRDFVFDKHFLKGFTQALPKAEVHAFEDAGHYVLEDKADVLVPAIRQFLDRT